ncbi:MAG: class I SAM-dependent methyltransferase [Planctomycetota bacterium]
MNHEEVGKFWNANAEAWTHLSRQGCDIYRDRVNTPVFLEMLPDISGATGLDIGCGEGHNTRLLSRRGAAMWGIDISTRFIGFAEEKEREEPHGIHYSVACAASLPFPDHAFDFAAAFMSFMDMPDYERALSEAYRVIKPGGFLQFSISHPCFFTPHMKWVLDEDGRRIAMESARYFEGCEGEIEEWIFSTATSEQKKAYPAFRIPRFYRTLAEWCNLLLDVGFTLERFAEPRATDEALRDHPTLSDTHVIAYFLIVRCRK